MLTRTAYDRTRPIEALRRRRSIRRVYAKKGNSKRRRGIAQVPVERGERQPAAPGQLQIGGIVEREVKAAGELQGDSPGSVAMESRESCVRALSRKPASIRLRLSAICKAFATSRRHGAFLGDLGRDGIRARRSFVFEKPARRQRGVENQARSRPSLMRSSMPRPPSVALSLMPRMAAARASTLSPNPRRRPGSRRSPQLRGA